MKKIILILAIITININIYSQTTIPAGNVSGTWTAENSPYLITGDILIATGSTLNIEPNVTVEFQGFYKLAVEGQLLALGEKDNLITFTINDTTGYSNENITNGGWHGIRFENNTSTDTSKIIFCSIKYCKLIENYELGSAVFAENFYFLILENSSIFDNYCKEGSIVYANNTNFTFNNNNIFNNKGQSAAIIIRNINYVNCHNNQILNNQGTGLRLWQVSNAHITNNLICNNSYCGIWIDAANPCYDIILSNNTICNNYPYQVFIDELYTDVLFYNTILWGNNSENVSISSNSSCSFYYCNIQNGMNSLHADWVSNYENNIETDPEFINPTTGIGWEYNATNKNWKLNETSPCIDTGTPDTTGLNLNLPETDLAGETRFYNNTIDIGAYEYPGYINVNEIEKQNYFNVYPNPGNETITVLSILNQQGNIQLQMITQTGRVIYSESFKNQDYISKQINISDYAKGIYILKIITENNEYTKKIIIQ
jgi:hypothetical protein